MKISNTCILLSPHNISVPEKITKLVTLNPIILIDQDKHYLVMYVQTSTAQSQQITTLAKLPKHSKP